MTPKWGYWLLAGIGIAICLIWWKVDGCKKETYALYHVKQIPFNQRVWLSVRRNDIEHPNPRAAMKADLLRRWQFGTKELEVMMTLGAPDQVLDSPHMRDQIKGIPASGYFALKYDLTRDYDGWVTSVVYIFDSNERLINAKFLEQW